MSKFQRFTATVMIGVFGIIMYSMIHRAWGAEVAGITTGASNATYYQVGQDIAKACGNVVPLTVYESAGSVSNVERVLADKRYQYGITQQDALAYKALSDSRAKDKIKMVMPLYDNDIHVIASVASGIKNQNDLRGKRVVVGQNGSGNWVTAQLLKAKLGIDWQDIVATNESGLTMLLLGQADAMVYMVGKPAPILQKVGKAGLGKIRLVPLNSPALDSFYIGETIPDGIYDWSPTPVHTYAVKNVLVTFDYKAQFQKEIGALTQCIVKNLPNLQESGHDKWREVDPHSYSKVKWPVHPMAKPYLDGAK